MPPLSSSATNPGSTSPQPAVREAGAPSNAVVASGTALWGDLAAFLAVAVQLGLILLLVWRFRLESESFSTLMSAACAGFLVHHFLPLRWRLPFFGALSLACIPVVVGVVPGVTLIGIGLALIGLCHLPVPFWGRVAALAVVGGVLTLLRADSNRLPEISVIWPILGSMFIFRVLVYLYDLKHRSAPFSFDRAVSYFFMLPNPCFPLFPIVDYKTFCSTYHNEERLKTYQSGLQWMIRGVVHLLLYRIVYQFGGMDIVEVEGASDVAYYMVATYLLYLKVSGQFHLIVGLLHLFGFNLPETHHLYLLASSFTDFWRRINIYWKDFITKLFFNPAFFALRGLGTLRAIALATVIAFFATWLLHSWQWFWFRRSMLVTWQDVLFWTILGVLVLANVLYEAAAGKKRSLTKDRVTLSRRLQVGLKTMATFAVICTLWTFWSSQTRGELLVLAENALRWSLKDVLLVGTGLAVIALSGAIWGQSKRETSQGSLARRADPYQATAFWRSAAGVVAGAACLLALPAVGNSTGSSSVENVVAAICEDRVSSRDANVQRRGYYEELDEARVDNELQRTKQLPKGWLSGLSKLYRKREGYLDKELIPLETGDFRGAPVTINRWGMRDGDYSLEKPEGVYRIVLVGSSHEFGSGVNEGESFESLLEERLNRELPDSRYSKYEILNLSMGGLDVFRKLILLEERGFQFDPDAVIFVTYNAEQLFIGEQVVDALKRGCDMPDPFLADVVAQTRVSARTPAEVAQNRLYPHRWELIGGAFRRLADDCARHDVRPFVMYRPAPLKGASPDSAAARELSRLAADAKIEMLDLHTAFDHVQDRSTLVVAPWDDHTNALGHRLLAARLYDELSGGLSSAAAQQATGGASESK